MNLVSDKNLNRLLEEASEPVLTGTRYTIVRPIGSGGMGRVFLARDNELQRDVALKVMNVPHTGELARRMMAEARVIASLEHPGIVPVHDVGTLEDGSVFFTMKFVQGQRLDSYVSEGFPVPELIRCFLKICETVAFAHSRGVLHRDLKPENIMVGQFGEVLVMDWGIAKVLSRNARDTSDNSNHSEFEYEKDSKNLSSGLNEFSTAYGAVMGTPEFMSPEQASGRSEEVCTASDVYGLGAVLYYMLTGEPPQFSSGKLRWAPDRQNLTRPLRAICARCLSISRVSRYSSAGELSEDIIRYLDDESVSAYRENFFEKVGRWLARNHFLVLLILAYLLMRIAVFLFARR